MILEEYYPTLKKVYFCEFPPGIGGDFFISLYGLSNKKFFRPNINDEQSLVRRLNEYQLLPGCNLGGKWIDKLDIMKEKIATDLKMWGKPQQYPEYINFASHPYGIRSHQTINPHEERTREHAYHYVQKLTNVPINKVVIVPSTFGSAMFSVFYTFSNDNFTISRDYNYILDHLDILLNFYCEVDNNISLISDTDSIVLDHIDYLLTNKDMKELVSKVVDFDDIDISMFNILLDYYKGKLNRYNTWVEELKQHPIFDKVYQMYISHPGKKEIDKWIS